MATSLGYNVCPRPDTGRVPNCNFKDIVLNCIESVANDDGPSC